MNKRPNTLLNILSVIFAAVVIGMFACPSHAQETQVGVVANITPSTGAGYATGYGAAVIGVGPVLRDRVIAVGQVGGEHSAKLYLGPHDGSVIRARGEARYYYAGQPGPNDGTPLRFFVSGGVNYSRTNTSQYSKQAFNALLGGGVNVKQVAIGRYHYLLRERQTLNQVSGHRAGLDFYLPTSHGSKWTYLFSIEYQRWRFYQPTGPLAGERHASSVGLSFGIGRRLGE